MPAPTPTDIPIRAPITPPTIPPILAAGKNKDIMSVWENIISSGATINVSSGFQMKPDKQD